MSDYIYVCVYFKEPVLFRPMNKHALLTLTLVGVRTLHVSHSCVCVYALWCCKHMLFQLWLAGQVTVGA